MLDFINTEINPEMLIWTGDNNAHNVWENTAEEVTEYMNVISKMISDTFTGSGTKILPVQGNHDTWVVDQESFVNPGDNYEIDHFKDSWSQWLTEDAFEVFGQYGYYSMDIELERGTVSPNTRLIAINTQVCDSLNWHLMGERQDPGGMFEWLK